MTNNVRHAGAGRGEARASQRHLCPLGCVFADSDPSLRWGDVGEQVRP